MVNLIDAGWCHRVPPRVVAVAAWLPPTCPVSSHLRLTVWTSLRPSLCRDAVRNDIGTLIH
jgi:hypothetical protein